MKYYIKYYSLILLFTCLTIGKNYAEEITDIIQPIKLNTLGHDTILVSDLFYSKHYNIQFSKNNDISVSYNSKTNLLALKVINNNFGATLIEFTKEGMKNYIPIIMNSRITSQRVHKFTFIPETKIKNVTVTGSFNNWNKENDHLKDVNGNGIYELDVPLDPGSYLYKFVVDGKEILDPTNPEKTPTGFDDFNSVLRIADTDSAKIFLHIGGHVKTKEEIVFTFIYENQNQSAPLSTKDVIALLNNAKVNDTNIRLSRNTIEIRFNEKELKGEKILRVLVSQKGKNTNLQQVQLHDADPAGKSSKKLAWDDGVIYSIMIDRFNDGDKLNTIPVKHDSIFVQANYQGGDFQGIINKIEDGYFDSLGINILWISPVYDNPNIAFREYPAPHRWYSGYHGYWPISEKNVEKKFGTMDDLKALIAKAHGHNIKVLLDIVAHHVHIDNPLYKEHPDWFGTLELPDGRKNLRLWDEQRLTTWFEPYMPSFDYTRSSEPIEYMADNCIWWLKETGADGLRHDAVKHVPNEFWRVLTKKLKQEIEIPTKTKVYQIGETFGDYDLVASYVNNGQLSAQFNFNLSYFAIPVFIEPEESFASIDFHMKKSFEAFGYNNVMGNIMDSHDKVRFMAYADGDVKMQGVDTRELAWNNPPAVNDPKSYDKAKLYYAYLFTIPGLPVVYYGSEFGMTGADDPDNRRMMRFGDSLSIYEKQMLQEMQKIIKIRNQHSALRYGDFYTLRADDKVYAYLRSDMNERLLIVLNKSEKEENVEFHLPEAYSTQELIDIVNGEKISVLNHKASAAIAAMNWRMFKVIH